MMEYSCRVLVGAPLLHLGGVSERQEEFALFTPTGKKTGRKAVAQRIVFVAHNGREFEIATNEHSLGGYVKALSWSRMPLVFDGDAVSWVDEEDEAVDFAVKELMWKWVHVSSSLFRSPATVVVGLELDLVELDGCKDIELVDESGIKAAKAEAEMFLAERFGYTGQAQLLLQLCYDV